MNLQAGQDERLRDGAVKYWAVATLILHKIAGVAKIEVEVSILLFSECFISFEPCL